MFFCYKLFPTLFTLGVLVVPYGEAVSETLNQAIQRALIRSPELTAGQLLLLEAEEGITRARSAWRPDISLKIKGGRKRSTLETTTAPSDTASFAPVSATLSISQHLFDFGASRAAVKKSRISKSISIERLRKVKQDIIIGAVFAYFGVWKDLNLLQIAASNEEILGQQLAATETRFSMREVTRTDVSQARARLQDATSNRIAADLSLQESLAVYEETVGAIEAIDTISWSADRLKSYQLPINLEAAKFDAYTNNSDMRQLRFEQQLAKYSLFERRSALLPEMSIEATVSNSRNVTATLEKSRDMIVEGVLTVPLYDSGTSWSSLKSAKIDTRILLENEKTKKLSLDRKIRSLWNTLQRTDGQISSIEASIAANKIALQGVRREVEVGTRTTLHLLDAENEYVQARASLITAVHDKSQSHFLLMLECGMLDKLFDQ